MADILQQYQDGFETNVGQAWAKAGIERIQQYHQAKAVADANTQARADFVTNVSGVKDDLVGLVRSDPAASELALDLVPHTLGGLFVGADPAVVEQAAPELVTTLQRDIAHATVQRLGELDRDAAMQAMSHPRIAALLDDDEKLGLTNYADQLHGLRERDVVAQRAEAQRKQNIVSGVYSTALFGTLVSPQTNEVTFPPDWGQQVATDTRIKPNLQRALLGAYDRLQVTGDLRESNPAMLAQLVSRASLHHTDPDHPSHEEVFDHVGVSLNAADAGFIAGLLGPQSVDRSRATSGLALALDDAKSQIAPAINGPAGEAAFGRFAGWFVPAYRQGLASGKTHADLMDPEKGLLARGKLQQFAPTSTDAIQHVIRPPEMRRPLAAIFGGV